MLKTYHGGALLWRCCFFSCQRGTELVFSCSPFKGDMQNKYSVQEYLFTPATIVWEASRILRLMSHQGWVINTHTTQAGRSTHCGQVLPAFSNFQLRKQVELIEKAGRTYYRLTQEELWRCCSFGCQRGTELVFQNAPYIGAKLGQSPGIPNSPGIPHKSGIPHFRRNNYVYYLQTCNYR